MLKQYVFFLLLVLSLFACANIGSPKGGPEDKTPPILDIDESTENFQTNFKKQAIELNFDEFIELKDIFTQVIITPPLDKRWKLSKKLKTVTFEFDKDEVLREEATYIINFGEAIRDYTAGNAVPDFRFVFSTGSYIDSMEVSGTVVDAITGQPAADILLMLYDNLSDTVVRTEKPFYFAKTDKSGAYKIENVKTDTFKVFALKDADLNYLFNQESELIGFPDSTFFLSNNKETLPPIGVFLESPEVQMVPPRNDQFGMVKLKFNQTPFEVDIRHEDIGQQILYETEEDSIKVWYNQEDTTAWNIFVKQDSVLNDTFLVKPPDRTAFLKKDSLKRANARIGRSIKLNPTKPIKVLFNHPLGQIDSTTILLLEDSIATPVIPDLKIEQRNLVINYRWKEAMTYQLLLLPGSVTDIFQLQNQDTIKQQYQVMEKKSFGDINLKILDLNPKEAYVIKLYFKNNTNLVEANTVNGQATFERQFKTIPAGEYLVEIITDVNGNGRWDSGNYDKQSQPEPIFTTKLKELKENWEIDEEITYKK